MADSVAFTCNGEEISVALEADETLLTVLRERLGLTSAKDGCAPQGQCGCCTVLVDGAPRVACVTPALRVQGRAVTTIEGVAPERLAPLVDAFVGHGASQCGFCTPGIVLRSLALVEGDRVPTRLDMDRALAAHLCRCTGWNSILDAVADAAGAALATDATKAQRPGSSGARTMAAAAAQAQLEGHTAQRVGRGVVCGDAGFADDGAPRDALVAVPKPVGSHAEAEMAAGIEWIVGSSLHHVRTLAAKVQGRRTTVPALAPLPCPLPPASIDVAYVKLATAWNEPAYLEPDASWCEPGGEPAPMLGNGGAFGAKRSSVVAQAARELANRYARPVRALFAREDVVRFGVKRAPIAACAWVEADVVRIDGVGPLAFACPPSPYTLPTQVTWRSAEVNGPPVSHDLRSPWAEVSVLTEGALDAARVDRTLIVDALGARVLLDVCVRSPDDAYVGASCLLNDRGNLERVVLKISCGELLDETVARSYCVGAAHMAIGWVLSEGLAVDAESGEVHDLTIRSFGIVRPKHMPEVDIEFVDDDRSARACSDAVFAATAAALWNAVARSDEERPHQFPALDSRASRALRR